MVKRPDNLHNSIGREKNMGLKGIKGEKLVLRLKLVCLYMQSND